MYLKSDKKKITVKPFDMNVVKGISLKNIFLSLYQII